MKIDYAAEIRALRTAVRLGKIDYNVARQKAEPLLSLLNARAGRVAEKNGRKFYPFVFAKF
jgi:hypothetical protein